MTSPASRPDHVAGKVVVITGAAGGFGLLTSLNDVDRGAHVPEESGSGQADPGRAAGSGDEGCTPGQVERGDHVSRLARATAGAPGGGQPWPPRCENARVVSPT